MPTIGLPPDPDVVDDRQFEMEPLAVAADDCIHPSHFFHLMEFQREKLPAMLRKNYIPIFIVNLLRDKVSPDSEEDSDATTYSSSTSSSPLLANNNSNINNGGRRRYKKLRLELQGFGIEGSGHSGGLQGQGMDWTEESFLENNADFEGLYFIAQDVREYVERVLFFALEIKNTSGIGLNLTEFVHLFCVEVEFPCLELIWLLDYKFRLMSFNVFLMRLKSKPQLDYFVNQLVGFCFSPCLLDEKTRVKSTEMLQDFLRSVIVAGYSNPESNAALVKLKEIAVNILVKIRQRLSAMSVESAAYQNLHLLIGAFRTVSVADSTKRRYFSDELTRILRLTPELSMEEILQQQEKIVEAGAGVGHRSMDETIAMLIGEPQTKKEIIATLEKNLSQPAQLNWTNFLATISVWEEREFESLRVMSLLKAAVKRTLIVGLEDGKESKSHVLAAFIVARHCCLISPLRFARYEEWFTTLFEKEFTTCARELGSFRFLIGVLAEVVPIEPPCFLQVHSAYPPFIPVGGDEIWRDYLAQVRARIAEYHEVEDAMIYEPNVENPIQHDVDMAIQAFNQTKKVPNRIAEIFILQRKYYLGSFLPTLIKKPLTAALSDARLRLIETLFAAGKIPKHIYTAHKSNKQI